MERDYLGDKNMRRSHYIDEFAKEIAALSLGWDLLDIPSDEGPVELGEALAGKRIRTIGWPKTMTSAATN